MVLLEEPRATRRGTASSCSSAAGRSIASSFSGCFDSGSLVRGPLARGRAGGLRSRLRPALGRVRATSGSRPRPRRTWGWCATCAGTTRDAAGRGTPRAATRARTASAPGTSPGRSAARRLPSDRRTDAASSADAPRVPARDAADGATRVRWWPEASREPPGDGLTLMDPRAGVVNVDVPRGDADAHALTRDALREFFRSPHRAKAAATTESIVCRLDLLSAMVRASDDFGRTTAALAKRAATSRERTRHAALPRRPPSHRGRHGVCAPRAGRSPARRRARPSALRVIGGPGAVRLIRVTDRSPGTHAMPRPFYGPHGTSLVTTESRLGRATMPKPPHRVDARFRSRCRRCRTASGSRSRHAAAAAGRAAGRRRDGYRARRLGLTRGQFLRTAAGDRDRLHGTEQGSTAPTQRGSNAALPVRKVHCDDLDAGARAARPQDVRDGRADAPRRPGPDLRHRDLHGTRLLRRSRGDSVRRRGARLPGELGQLNFVKEVLRRQPDQRRRAQRPPVRRHPRAGPHVPHARPRERARRLGARASSQAMIDPKRAARHADRRSTRSSARCASSGRARSSATRTTATWRLDDETVAYPMLEEVRRGSGSAS